MRTWRVFAEPVTYIYISLTMCYLMECQVPFNTTVMPEFEFTFYANTRTQEQHLFTQLCEDRYFH